MAESTYLNFKAANCKNCYKCLRECPVKAITVIHDQARIKDELCILCGNCAGVCRFNAKEVVDGTEKVRSLLASGKKVIASVAPAYVASFQSEWSAFSAKLLTMGFYAVEETARGAHSVTAEYRDLLESGKYKNLIASACPAIVRLIQIYYPEALPYLAMVDSPMVAHAKLIKAEYGDDAEVVFVGPCIAKKREADESGLISAVLTFEELAAVFSQEPCASEISAIALENGMSSETTQNRAKYYPINRGIIKSFEGFTEGYEYISVDGVTRAAEVLSNIETLSGMFIEMHACEFSCINGPCSLNKQNGGFIKATEEVRKYAGSYAGNPLKAREKGDFRHTYLPLRDIRKKPAEKDILAIMQEMGKFTPEDEFNCGACGYNTCRDKAIAVYNGMAELEMCIPYMRERAEGMSYDIIKNSPNGIIAVDSDLKIIEINSKAIELLGIPNPSPKGELLEKYYNPVDFFLALHDNRQLDHKKTYVDKTKSWIEISIRKMTKQNMLFCFMKDITDDMDYNQKLSKLRDDTASAADEVIQRQMQVVQEIASLLGETAAETKIALIKLKNTLKQEENR